MKFEDENELEELLFGNHLEEYDNYLDGNLCTEVKHTLQFRQFEVKGYGIIDILGIDYYREPDFYNITITIYELKNGPIDMKAISQISRYYIGVKRYISNLDLGRFRKRLEIYLEINGILVGSEYPNDGSCFVVDSIPWLSCYFFDISKSGVNFTETDGWYRENEDLKWKNPCLCDGFKMLVNHYRKSSKEPNYKADGI